MRREPLRRLRDLREARYLSQAQLAKAAGLSVAGVIRLEQGQRHPWPRTARVLAIALGVEPEALYGATMPVEEALQR